MLPIQFAFWPEIPSNQVCAVWLDFFRNHEITLTQFQDLDELPNFSDYAGTYFNNSVNASLKVKARKDQLMARKGIINIPLIIFEKVVFYAPQNVATLYFNGIQFYR